MATRAAREALLRRFPARVIRRALAQQEMREVVNIDDDGYSGLVNSIRMHILTDLEISKFRNFLLLGICCNFIACALSCLIFLVTADLSNFDDPRNFQEKIISLTPSVFASVPVLLSLATFSIAEVWLVVKYGNFRFIEYIFPGLTGFLARATTVSDVLATVVFWATESSLFSAWAVVFFLGGFLSTFYSQLRGLISIFRKFDHFGWDSPERLIVFNRSPPPFDWVGDSLAAAESVPLENLEISSSGIAAVCPSRDLRPLQLAQLAGNSDFLLLAKNLEISCAVSGREVLAFSAVSLNFFRAFAVDFLLMSIKLIFLASYGNNILISLSLGLSLVSGSFRFVLSLLPASLEAAAFEDSEN